MTLEVMLRLGDINRAPRAVYETSYSENNVLPYSSDCIFYLTRIVTV
jgi:hypothetical protein